MTTDVKWTAAVDDLINLTNLPDKIKKYTDINQFLSKNLCLNTQEEQLLIICLRRDITENNVNLKTLILDISEFLIRTDKDIMQTLNVGSLLKIANNGYSKDIQHKSQKLLHTVISNCLLEEDITIIATINESYKIDMELFANICKDFPTKKLASILTKLMHNLFQEDYDSIKDFICDIALMLVKDQKVAEEVINCNQKDLITDIPQYILYINNLRNESKELWHKLCNFLIRLLFTYTLSKRIDLINGILRLLQNVFQNGTTNEKLLAYDCWSELIISYSLNKNCLLYEEKTMQLLMKPIKTRLCKSYEVLLKRFEIWTQLLLQLGDKYEECIEKFLKFCFISLKNVDEYNEFLKGVAFPKILWPKSTEMLIAMFGHQCHLESTKVCLNREGYTFNKQIISNGIFERHYQIIIPSTIECYKMLPFWANATTTTEVSKCLCLSLLEKVNEVEDALRQSVLEKLAVNVKVIVEVLQKNSNTNLEDFITNIVDYKWKCDNVIIFKIIFVPIFSMILENATTNYSTYKKVFLEVLNTYSSLIDSEEFYSITINLLTSKSNCNMNFSLALWNVLTKSLINWFNIHLNNEILQNKMFELIMWLLENYDLNLDVNKETILHWDTTTHFYFSHFPTEINTLMQKITEVSKNKSIYNMSFIQLLSTLITYIIQQKDSKQGFNILEILSEVLSSPSIIKPNVLLPLLDYLIDLNLSNNRLQSNILLCIERFIYPHKEYGVLLILSKYIDKYPSVKSHITPGLMLQLNEINVNSIKNKATVKFLNSIRSKKEERIMTRQNSTLCNKEYSSPKTDSLFNFFGQKSTNSSPISTRSAKKNNTNMSKRRGRPKLSLPFITTRPEDEDSAKFVAINEEYQFQPKKLSKHQKEVFRKQRDDIPALYQDLSQSKSNLYENSSNSTLTQASTNDLANTTETSKDTSLNPLQISVQMNKDTKKLFGNFASNSDSTKLKYTFTIDPEIIENEKNNECEDFEENMDENKVVKSDDENQETKIIKKKKRMCSEMEKIKMDIVGVEDFVKPTKIRVNRVSNFSFLHNRIHRRNKTISNNEKPTSKRGRKKNVRLNSSMNTSISNNKKPESNVEKNTEDIALSLDIVENSQKPSKYLTDYFSPKIKSKVTKNVMSIASNETNVKASTIVSPRKENSISGMDTISPVVSVSLQKDKTGKDIDKMNDSTICDMSTLTLSNKDISLSDLDTQPITKSPQSDSQITILSDCVVKLEALSDECIAKLTPREFRVDKDVKRINLPSSPVLDDTPVRISNLIHETNDISPIRVENKESVNDDHKIFNSPPQISGESQETPKRKPKFRTIKIPNARLEMLQNLKPNVLVKENNSKVNNKMHTSSPHSDRIKKIITKCEIKINKKSPEEAKSKDLLTFTKTVPGAEATPRSSILKRKIPDTPHEGLSPSAKKKRVNFSDPPTTSEKIFESECSQSSSNNIVQRLIEIFDNLDKSPEKDVEDITHDKPIYPNLILDKTKVQNVLKYLCNQMHVSKLANKLKKNNIKTVGDLAKLSNVNIVRLPILCPKLVSVRNAFKLYENEIDKKEPGCQSNLELNNGIKPLDSDKESKVKILYEIMNIIKKNDDLSVDEIVELCGCESGEKVKNLIVVIKDFIT